MSDQDRERWNRKHASCKALAASPPDVWLVEALQIIESRSPANNPRRRALDLACGLGHNGVWLAQRGWIVDAVDISGTALRLAEQRASANAVEVRWIEADLDVWAPEANQYDLIIVFRFLDRQTVPRVVRSALRRGGWLIYETFSAAHCERSDSHITNPGFTLAPGELTRLFPDFDTLDYREDVLSERTVQRFLGKLGKKK